MGILSGGLACILALMLAPASAFAQKAALPGHIDGGRYDVLLVSAPVARTLSEDSRISLLVQGCRRRMRVTGEDSAAAVQARAWPLTEGYAIDPSVLTIIVLPGEPIFVNCGDQLAQNRIAAARGLRITLDSMYNANRDVRRVVLKRGDRVIDPLLSERTLVQRLGANGVSSNGSGFMRISLPIDSLAPDADGRIDDLRLEVWNDSDSLPSVVHLPWADLAAAWEHFLAVRGESAFDAGARPDQPVFLAALPRDAGLQRARAQLLADDTRAANSGVAARLSEGSLRGADLLHARTQLGISLAALGDTASARVLLGLAVTDEPCLSLTSSAPEHVRRLVDALHRPTATCTSPPLWRTAIRGALVPGFGRAATHTRRNTSATILVAVVGAMATSVVTTSKSRRTYSDYLAVDLAEPGGPQPRSEELYSVAEAQRASAITVMRIGAAIWAGSWLESVVSQHRYGRHLEDIRGYGAVRAGPTVTPRGGSRGLGLSINFF